MVLAAALLAGCAGSPPAPSSPAASPPPATTAEAPSAAGYVAPVLTYAESVGEVAEADEFAPVNPFAYRNPWR